MLVADLHREAARRYVDTMPISEWAHAMLEVLGAPPAGRTPACVAELVSGVGSLGPRWWNTFRFQSSTRWPASTRGRRAHRSPARRWRSRPPPRRCSPPRS